MRILLVEDDRRSREFLAKGLVEEGYVVDAAPDGEDGLHHALDREYDLMKGNLPGHEIEYPMALVILGGLVTSTLLNLLILPALYGWLGKPASDQEKAHDSVADVG